MSKFLQTKAYHRDNDIVGKDSEKGYHLTVGAYLFGIPFAVALVGVLLWLGADLAHNLQCVPDPNFENKEVCPAGYIQSAVYARGIAVAAFVGALILFVRAGLNVKANYHSWKEINCFCFSCLTVLENSMEKDVNVD